MPPASIRKGRSVLEVKVWPLARHIIETKEVSETLHKINKNLDDNNSHIIEINKNQKLNIHKQNGKAYITGYACDIGYHFDESRFYFSRINFPISLMRNWDRDIAEGKMKGERLIDLEPFKDRKVLGYKIYPDLQYTLFSLQLPSESEITTLEKIQNRHLNVHQN